jgi:hypothetical protein
VDRSRRGLWIGLALGAIALVVCCVGGIVGIGVVGVAATDQMQQQAQRTVRTFLDAVREGDFDKAHTQICEVSAQRRPAYEIEREFKPLNVRGYRLGEVQTSSSQGSLVLEATLTGTGGERRYRFYLSQERDKLRICGWDTPR